MPGCATPSVEVDSSDDQDNERRCYQPVDGSAERWPPPRVGDKVMTVLPEVLESVAGIGDDEEPSRSSRRRCGEHDEYGSNGHFNDDDLWPPIRDRKAYVDSRDERDDERVGRGEVQPPERGRGHDVDDAEDDAPQDRRSDRSGVSRHRVMPKIRSS